MGGRGGFLRRRVDQKTLTIGRDDILLPVNALNCATDNAACSQVAGDFVMSELGSNHESINCWINRTSSVMACPLYFHTGMPECGTSIFGR